MSMPVSLAAARARYVTAKDAPKEMARRSGPFLEVLLRLSTEPEPEPALQELAPPHRGQVPPGRQEPQAR